MRLIHVLFFLSLFTTTHLAIAQNQISNFTSIATSDQSGLKYKAATITWNEDLYHVLSEGESIIFYNTKNNAVTKVDLDIECLSYKWNNFRVGNNTFYIIVSNVLFEIDLNTLALSNKTPIPDIEVSDNWWLDSEMGLLLEGTCKDGRCIGRINLIDGSIVTKAVETEKIFPFGNGAILTDEVLNTAVYYNMLAGTEISISTDFNLSIKSDELETYFYADNNQNIIKYTLDNGNITMCQNFEDPLYGDEFINGNYLTYFYLGTTTSASTAYYLFDLESCNNISSSGNFNPFGQHRPRWYKDRYWVNINNQQLNIFDTQSSQTTTYPLENDQNLIIGFAYNKIVLRTNLDNNSIIFTTIDLLTEDKNEYLSGITENNLTISAAENNRILMVGGSTNGSRAILLDHQFSTISEVNLTESYNRGLPGELRFNKTANSPYAIIDQNIYQVLDNNFQRINDFQYDQSPFLQNGKAYGYISEGENTFFTIAENGQILYKVEVPDQIINTQTKIASFENKVVQVDKNKMRTIFPQYEVNELELEYEIHSIIDRFDEKVLCFFNKMNAHYLGFFDGNTFEILENVNVPNILHKFTSSVDDEDIVTLILRNGSNVNVFSYDKNEGKVFNNDKFIDQNLLVNFQRFTNRDWKSFIMTNGNEFSTISTNGKSIVINEYDQSEIFLGSSDISYTNDHLFIMNATETYVQTNDDLIKIDAIDNGARLQDVIHLADTYYAIKSDLRTLSVIKAVVPTFADYETIFTIDRGFCNNPGTPNKFQSTISDSALLLSLNTAEFGTELFILHGNNSNVSLLSDINPGPSSGFSHFNFVHKNKLHFSGLTPNEGLQLYTLDLQSESPLSAPQIERPAVKMIGVYPNPTENILSMDKELKQIRIFNSQGNQIQYRMLDTYKMDVSQLTTGLYHLTGIGNDGRLYRGKFVKAHP